MLRNLGFSAASNLSRFLASGVLFIVLAAFWPPEIFGRFVYHNVVALVAAMVVDYGLSVKTMRDTSSGPDAAAAILGSSLRSQACLTLPSVLIVGGVWAFGIVSDPILLLLLWVGHLLFVLVNTGYGTLRGLKRFRDEASAALIGNTAFFVFPISLLVLEPSLHLVAGGMAFARLLQAGTTIGYVRRCLPETASSQRPTRTFSSMRTGLPYALESWTSGLLQNVDSLVVRYVLGEVALGIYQAGIRFTLVSVVAVQALANLYVPVLISCLPETSSFRRAVRNCLILFASLGVAGLGAFWLVGAWIADLVYGSAYFALGALMPMFGLVVLARCTGAGYGIVLIALGRELYRFYAVAAATLLFVPLGIMAAELHGLAGILSANVMALGLLGAMYWWRVRQDLLRHH